MRTTKAPAPANTWAPVAWSRTQVRQTWLISKIATSCLTSQYRPTTTTKEWQPQERPQRALCYSLAQLRTVQRCPRTRSVTCSKRMARVLEHNSAAMEVRPARQIFKMERSFTEAATEGVATQTPRRSSRDWSAGLCSRHRSWSKWATRTVEPLPHQVHPAGTRY